MAINQFFTFFSVFIFSYVLQGCKIVDCRRYCSGSLKLLLKVSCFINILFETACDTVFGMLATSAYLCRICRAIFLSNFFYCITALLTFYLNHFSLLRESEDSRLDSLLTDSFASFLAFLSSFLTCFSVWKQALIGWQLTSSRLAWPSSCFRI